MSRLNIGLQNGRLLSRLPMKQLHAREFFAKYFSLTEMF
ncbi:hypothetical protein LEP1GSC050_3102 [Leptospira broomii serovar Hurstbridge str. 5399]|uniref:Uncharacterized protein n=1 Tax=Leptospira broomii serovar Hurstbridge str. 5399 TaxID=1049789 RepID=T0GFY5_9LEPT|nr:hypothetical protein LEP1GSC050_3102 [Leptospira broomii serovar Hurstbridge str. 5399]